MKNWLIQTAGALILVVGVLAGSPAYAQKKLDGQWLLTIKIPRSPAGEKSSTINVTLTVFPTAGSLHGRAVLVDDEGASVAAVWRQSGKKVFINYELPCEPDSTTSCGTVILSGKIKAQGLKLKKGKVIVVWDTANAADPSLYTTSTNSFSGVRIQD